MEAALPYPEPITIAVTPSGGRRTTVDHPALPLTPREIARAAASCLGAGASMLHLHVRRPDGRHLLDADAYRDTIATIRAAVGDRLVIQITSEALGLYSPEEQMAVVRAVRPEAVSLALRELVPDGEAELAFAAFMRWLRREEIVPQIVLYDPEEAFRLATLQAAGIVPFESLPVLYVLGRYTLEQTSRPSDLLPFLAPRQPRVDHWMTCAFGRYENACVVAAALLGGHMRVGFENNLLKPDGTVARDNADSVRQAAETLVACGGRLADAGALRSAWRPR